MMPLTTQAAYADTGEMTLDGVTYTLNEDGTAEVKTSFNDQLPSALTIPKTVGNPETGRSHKVTVKVSATGDANHKASAAKSVTFKVKVA